LFVDQPAGAGFSQAADSDLIVNERGVVDQMLEFLRQFYVMFPEYRTSEFYIAGEYYGGKYGPALAYGIHQQRFDSNEALPLTGLIVADGWTDPETQMTKYAGLLENFALIDSRQAAIVQKHMDMAQHELSRGLLIAAFNWWNAVWGDYSLGYPSLFTNFTGGTDTENLGTTNGGKSANARWHWIVTWLLRTASTRKALHIGHLGFGTRDVYKMFVESGDFMTSVKSELSTVMDNYRVLIYNGNLDGVCASPTTDAMVDSIVWRGEEQYLIAPRTIWRVRPDDDEVAGYARQVLNGAFARVVVRNAGHLLPTDQPERAFDMIDRFISRRGF